MNNNDRIVFVMMFCVIFVCFMFGIGYLVYKTELKKQAYYDCLEYNKQIVEKIERDVYNSCYMF